MGLCRPRQLNTSSFLEKMGGVSQELMHEHEETAVLSLGLMLGVGALALVGLILSFWNMGISRLVNFLVLLGGIVLVGSMGYTAYTGGQIRHPEIRPSFKMPDKPETERESDDS